MNSWKSCIFSRVYIYITSVEQLPCGRSGVRPLVRRAGLFSPAAAHGTKAVMLIRKRWEKYSNCYFPMWSIFRSWKRNVFIYLYIYLFIFCWTRSTIIGLTSSSEIPPLVNRRPSSLTTSPCRTSRRHSHTSLLLLTWHTFCMVVWHPEGCHTCGSVMAASHLMSLSVGCHPCGSVMAASQPTSYIFILQFYFLSLSRGSFISPAVVFCFVIVYLGKIVVWPHTEEWRKYSIVADVSTIYSLEIKDLRVSCTFLLSFFIEMYIANTRGGAHEKCD